MDPKQVSAFVPTPESIPPCGQAYRLRWPTGLPVNIHPLNPVAFLARAALLYPKSLAIAHPDAPNPSFYSFEVWAQRVQNHAYALMKAGIKPGDRVAVVSPNTPMMADALQGVIAARAVLVPINIRLKPSDVTYILEHSGSSFILVDSQFTHLVEKSTAPIVVCYDTGKRGDPYEEFLSSGRRYSAERGWDGLEMEGDENAAALLCYTSGTTGRPKGVITTYRGTYLAAIANAYESNLQRESAYLWVLPMFHAGGWTYPWSCTFAQCLQITLRTVDNNLIWSHLNHRATHFCAAPTVLIGLVNHPGANRLSRPTNVIIAGAAPTAHLLAELEMKNFLPIHVYGLTETYGPFTRGYSQDSWHSLPAQDRSKLLARQGQSFVTADNVRVVYELKDDNMTLRDVPRDSKTVGEIVTGGNITMKEYFQDEEATQKAFLGGVFHSGDLAVMHPDGAISVMDRSKDIIISGGENASSLAIEQELATHPDIMEVSVIARLHPKWGERPMAFVILHARSVDKWRNRHIDFEGELKQYSRDLLPGFACPEWVQIVTELPKGGTGKVSKVELRKRIAKL